MTRDTIGGSLRRAVVTILAFGMVMLRAVVGLRIWTDDPDEPIDDGVIQPLRDRRTQLSHRSNHSHHNAKGPTRRA